MKHVFPADKFTQQTFNTVINYHRVSTNLTEQIPGDFQEIPGGISRKIQDTFALLRFVPNLVLQCSFAKYGTKT